MYLNGVNKTSARDFVKISDFCIYFDMYSIFIQPLLMLDLKWWYLKAMCFVLGEKLVPVDMPMQYWLSFCTVHMKFGLEM